MDKRSGCPYARARRFRPELERLLESLRGGPGTGKKRIRAWTADRDTLAVEMKRLLTGAAFEGRAVDERRARLLIDRAEDLLEEVRAAVASLPTP